MTQQEPAAAQLANSGCTVSQVNKSIKAAKAIFTYAFDLEYVTSNIMQRYPRLQRVDGEPKANRGVFTEAELQAIFASATPFELGLFATLSISGPRLARSTHSTGRWCIWRSRSRTSA